MRLAIASDAAVAISQLEPGAEPGDSLLAPLQALGFDLQHLPALGDMLRAAGKTLDG